MKETRYLQSLFESYLKNQSFGQQPPNLYEPFDYILSLKAKRIRPLLLLMATDLFGGQVKKALPQALAIELFHNFTLIHDDIMDEAPLRRGKPTIHARFGLATAILSGDAMLVSSYEQLIRAEAKLIPRLLKSFNQCALKVCEGQQLDMNYEKQPHVSVKEYISMIGLKTATLLATSLQIGAIMGGAGEKEANRMYEFGKHCGISFQLRDDWLDVFGESHKVGKQAGGDIIRKKKTYLILEALRRANTGQKKKLLRAYSSEGVSDAHVVSEVKSIFDALGMREIAEGDIRHHFQYALNELEKIRRPAGRKVNLHQLAHDLLYREN
jgi:geranylgeranyl diphosphate synthase type II